MIAQTTMALGHDGIEENTNDDLTYHGGFGSSSSSNDNDNDSSSGNSSFLKLLTPLPTSNEHLTPEEIVSMCMSYLQDQRSRTEDHSGSGRDDENNNTSGLELCYNFSSDSCRMANGGSLESFLRHANNPVFQSMVGCDDWEVLNVGPEIRGTNTRGAMQTVLVRVVPDAASGQRNERQFLWTLMKERRPPRRGHFLVHECIAVGNAFAHTL